MDLYGPLFRGVLYPAWETLIRARPTLRRLDYLERTQWRSEDELVALQGGALRRLVRHAYENVPYYRRCFEAAGLLPSDVTVPADLLKLPRMSRVEARDPAERTSRVPPTPTILKTTGGTTGEPLSFGYEPDSEHWREAVKLRGYGWAGYRVGDRALHYWGMPTKKRPPAMMRAKVAIDRALRRDHYVNCGVRSEAELAATVAIIAREKPSFLICYTQAGADLARFVNERKLRTWGPMRVLCGAERLFDNDRAALAEAFGPEVYETYGCREVMLIATECEAHDGLHESMENLVVEIVVTDPDGKVRHAREGETGEVVLTDLHNFAMPFLRYANGDAAVAGPSGRCSCGRALRRIRAVDGRVTETLRDGTGNRVSGMVFNLIFSALAASVRQFQAVQHKDGSITLKVVPTGRLDESARAHVHAQSAKYLRGVQVDLETVESIPASSSGKRRPVIVER